MALLAAMLSSVPLAGDVTVTERATEAALAIVAIAGQVTTFPAPSTPALVALTKVAVAGSVSRITTLVAELGPLFRVVSV